MLKKAEKKSGKRLGTHTYFKVLACPPKVNYLPKNTDMITSMLLKTEIRKHFQPDNHSDRTNILALKILTLSLNFLYHYKGLY